MAILIMAPLWLLPNGFGSSAWVLTRTASSATDPTCVGPSGPYPIGHGAHRFPTLPRTFAAVEPVARRSREDVQVVVPHVLAARRFVVLPRRDALAGECSLQREGLVLRSQLEGDGKGSAADRRGSRRLVRDHKEVPRSAGPPLRVEPHCHVLVAMDGLQRVLGLFRILVAEGQT